MKKLIQKHFILHVTLLETRHTNFGIKLGFHWQMIYVGFINDVVCLHNTKWLKSYPPTTPDGKDKTFDSIA